LPKAMFCVLSNPSDDGCDREFDEWYSTVHAPDLVSLDGVVSATRYRVSDVQIPPTDQPAPYRYLCIYQIEGDDLKQLGDELMAQAAAGRVGPSATLDPNTFSFVFEPIGDPITRETARVLQTTEKYAELRARGVASMSSTAGEQTDR
jgi:hypothetical protein